MLESLGGRPRVQWPERSSPYYKLHVATERIGRAGEVMSRLGPPVEMIDTKSMISGVTKGKGPASQVTNSQSSSGSTHSNSSSRRTRALRRLTAEASENKPSRAQKTTPQKKPTETGTATTGSKPTGSAAESRKLVVSGSKPGTSRPASKGGIMTNATVASAQNTSGLKANSVIKPIQLPIGHPVVKSIKSEAVVKSSGQPSGGHITTQA